MVCVGFAVVDLRSNLMDSSVIFTEAFRTSKEKKKDGKRSRKVTEDDALRITLIVNRMVELVCRFSPDAVVAELPVGGARSAGAIKSMAFSTAMTVATFTILNLPVLFISPYDTKRIVGGVTRVAKGEDYKAHVIAGVKKVWPNINWPRMKKLDKVDPIQQEAIADALGAAIVFQSMKPDIGSLHRGPQGISNSMIQ